jgi:hypothetical protein
MYVYLSTSAAACVRGNRQQKVIDKATKQPEATPLLSPRPRPHIYCVGRSNSYKLEQSSVAWMRLSGKHTSRCWAVARPSRAPTRRVRLLVQAWCRPSRDDPQADDAQFMDELATLRSRTYGKLSRGHLELLWKVRMSPVRCQSHVDRCTGIGIVRPVMLIQ